MIVLHTHTHRVRQRYDIFSDVLVGGSPHSMPLVCEL